MGLKRVNMELMRGEKSRLATFGKRKASLMKKASEFSILCAVDACVIVFGPRHDGTGPLRVETWPPNRDEVNTVIRKFKQSDRPKKNYTLEDYFADKKKNANVEAAKLREKNLKAKYPAPVWDDRLNTCSPDQLNELLGSLNSKIDLVGERLRIVKASSMQANQFCTQPHVALQHEQLIPYNPIQESWNTYGGGYCFQPPEQNLINNEDAVMMMARAHQDNMNQLGWHYNLLDNYATMPTYPVQSFLHQDQSQLLWQFGMEDNSNI